MKILVFLFTVFFVQGIEKAYACMPMPGADMFKTFGQNYPNYPHVILAELIAPGANTGGEGKFLVDVKEIIKGDMPTGRTALKADLMSSCGFYPDMDRTYTVFMLKSRDDRLSELTVRYAFPTLAEAKAFLQAR